MEQDMENIATDTVRPHIIVMLTDGQPTVGVTSENTLLRNVRERNKDKATIFSLGFGSGADMNLLEKISLQVCFESWRFGGGQGYTLTR